MGRKATEDNKFTLPENKAVFDDQAPSSDQADAEARHRYPRPNVIAIVERRSSADERPSRALCEFEPGYSVLVYSSLEAWHRAPNFSHSALAILCALDSGDPDAEVAEIERELALAKKLGVQVPIIVLSDQEDTSHRLKLIEHGICRYLTGRLSIFMPIQSILLGLNGEIPIPVERFVSMIREGKINSFLDAELDFETFTSRQKEIINAIQQGMRNKTIAHQLHLSEATVKVHIRNIMRKLNVQSRTEIVFRLTK
jgi:DNA-binding NarL/FixJ family response regulator